MAEATPPAIFVRDLRKAYPGAKTAAVDGVGFEIGAGALVALIGPNGAGKSTTLKILTGILHPTGGEARVSGLVPWTERKRLAYRIGAVFGQRSQLWGQLSARDSLGLLGVIYEIPRARVAERVARLAGHFELGELLDRPVRKLSLGERMRCEIVASLLHRPSIVFLDEPTIGLDVIAKQEVRELIREANREDGTTFILTSHDAGDIEQVCDRVIIIDHGKIVVDSSTGALRRQYLGTRTLELVSERELGPAAAWPAEIARGLALVKQTGAKAKLTLDTAQLGVDRALDFLAREAGVVDLMISAPPMEEILARIYRQGRPAPEGRTPEGLG